MGHDELIPTRHSLLKRLKDWSDETSWEDFFNTYWRLIYGVAIKSGLTEQEAQDVVQETVMTIAKNIKQFELYPARGSFKSWLLTTTRWRIADQFRKRPPPAGWVTTGADETARTSTLDRIPDPGSLELEAVWERDWEQNLVAAAMDKVKQQCDPEYYQMFDLHVLKQWPAHKVARKLGVKIGKIYFAKYKISRQIKKEVRRLEKNGV